MNFRKRSTKSLLRIVLMLNNLTVEEFAKQHGFPSNTVLKVINRHWGEDTRPRGELTMSILKELEAYFYKAPKYKELINEHSHSA